MKIHEVCNETLVEDEYDLLACLAYKVIPNKYVGLLDMNENVIVHIYMCVHVCALEDGKPFSKNYFCKCEESHTHIQSISQQLFKQNFMFHLKAIL